MFNFKTKLIASPSRPREEENQATRLCKDPPARSTAKAVRPQDRLILSLKTLKDASPAQGKNQRKAPLWMETWLIHCRKKGASSLRNAILFNIATKGCNFNGLILGNHPWEGVVVGVGAGAGTAVVGSP